MKAPPHAWFDMWPRGAARPGAPAATTWLARLARQLQQHLDDHDDTVTAFATRSGLAANTIRDVLDGKRWPTTHTVHAIIAAIGPDAATSQVATAARRPR